jgi:hypothetical protein
VYGLSYGRWVGQLTSEDYSTVLGLEGAAGDRGAGVGRAGLPQMRGVT